MVSISSFERNRLDEDNMYLCILIIMLYNFLNSWLASLLHCTVCPYFSTDAESDSGVHCH